MTHNRLGGELNCVVTLLFCFWGCSEIIDQAKFVYNLSQLLSWRWARSRLRLFEWQLIKWIAKHITITLPFLPHAQTAARMLIYIRWNKYTTTPFLLSLFRIQKLGQKVHDDDHCGSDATAAGGQHEQDARKCLPTPQLEVPNLEVKDRWHDVTTKSCCRRSQ